MPTEQAGPAFAPSLEGRSDPGDELGLQASVGPLSTEAVDPNAPGGFTDPGHLQEALQVSTAKPPNLH